MLGDCPPNPRQETRHTHSDDHSEKQTNETENSKLYKNMEKLGPPCIAMGTYGAVPTVGNGLDTLQKLDSRTNCIQENPKELRAQSDPYLYVNIHCNRI